MAALRADEPAVAAVVCRESGRGGRVELPVLALREERPAVVPEDPVQDEDASCESVRERSLNSREEAAAERAVVVGGVECESVRGGRGCELEREAMVATEEWPLEEDGALVP